MKSSRTILVFEYITGGGLAGRDLPPSWAKEGEAMRRAIARDFAAVPGIRVVTTIDPRLSSEEVAGVEVRRISRFDWGAFRALAEQAEYTLVIAPESDQILSRFAELIEKISARSLGCRSWEISLTGDKFRLARHFQKQGIPTPPSWTLESRLFDQPEWSSPIVVKPRWGAGSVGTVLVHDRQFPTWARPRRDFIAQPFVPGIPMSASILVDSVGAMSLLGVGRQRIEIDGESRISYQGGTIPARLDECPADVLRAVASVAGLRGFVGVDFLLGEDGQAIILEINPRPTTSYVGLARLFPPGTIAGAWLAAMDGPLSATDWPDRLRLPSNVSPITFDADGTIQPRSGDPRS